MKADISYLQSVLYHAGEQIITLFNSGNRRVMSVKNHHDILAEADVVSNTYITRHLRAKYPDVSIVSEESTKYNHVRSPYQFILDPLDGTINYSRGMEWFGISLALSYKEKPILGFVYLPLTKSWYIGQKGKGSSYNGKMLHISKTQSIEEAVVAVDISRAITRIPSYVTHMVASVRGFRSYGCSIQALGLLAKGQIDAYIYDVPKVWDVAAMQCILAEAGGVVTDYNGFPWQEGKPIVASTPGIHTALLDIISLSRKFHALKPGVEQQPGELAEEKQSVFL